LHGTGGIDVTEALAKCLGASGHTFSTTAELEIVRDIKEKLCFVALDVAEEDKKANATKYKLPDGQEIIVDKERYMAPEVLFEPSLGGLYANGVHEHLYNSIMNTDSDLRCSLFPLPPPPPPVSTISCIFVKHYRSIAGIGCFANPDTQGYSLQQRAPGRWQLDVPGYRGSFP
jgi:hypothetical protein